LYHLTTQKKHTYNNPDGEFNWTKFAYIP